MRGEGGRARGKGFGSRLTGLVRNKALLARFAKVCRAGQSCIQVLAAPPEVKKTKKPQERLGKLGCRRIKCVQKVRGIMVVQILKASLKLVYSRSTCHLN